MNEHVIETLERLVPESQAPADAEAMAGFPPTDIGNANRLVRLFGDRLRYCFQSNKWIVWDGQRWQKDKRGMASGYAKATVLQIEAEANNHADKHERMALIKHARLSQSAQKIRAMLELARDQLPVVPEEFDSHLHLLNCKNGVVDLKTGQLRPHDPKLMLSQMTNAEFKPGAAAPIWQALLKRLLRNDLEVVKFIKRVIGYSIAASLREQVLFILYGEGGNGKSTFVEALIKVFGDYASPGAPTLLIEAPNGHERHPTEVADIMGKRMVFCSETSEHCRLNETLVKQLTGGDKLKARFMNKDYFEFSPTHQLFLSTNHIPEIRGTDYGIWRRIQLIKCTEKILGHERIKDLDQTLLEEADGILTWAIEGCLEWRIKGLEIPRSVLRATEEYRSEQDVLGSFIEECCDIDARKSEGAEELFKTYQSWSRDRGERSKSQKRFGQALQERGFTRGKHSQSRRVIYHGLALRLLAM